MRTIWAIYRADLRRARRSLIALVVIFGLVVIPSLFTWFNVAASWDPFGNTRSLRIAIANTDAGYKSDLVPLHINIGDQVVSALRKIRLGDRLGGGGGRRDTLGWLLRGHCHPRRFFEGHADVLRWGGFERAHDVLRQRKEERH